MSNKVLMVVLLALVLALAACGGGRSAAPAAEPTVPAPVGDAAAGEALFNSATIGDNSAPGCVTCHSLEEGVVIVGPSQAGLAARAGQRVAGESADEYLRNSILHPNDYVVDGFAEGLMYQYYADDLTPEQIDDLVAYLETLK
ncbi:MAG: cytochrome c [Chloroflexota bacterium]